MDKQIPGRNNYELMRDRMQAEFLKYDITPMVARYQLKQDDSFYYIRFIDRDCQIGKTTGRIEIFTENEWLHANYNQSMTIFDVLCYAKPNAELLSEYTPADAHNSSTQPTTLSGGFFNRYATQFAGRSEELKQACIELGGSPYPVGEVAYQLKIFDFVQVLFQFWDADDEFDAQLYLKWNANIHDFMHYETTYYAAICLLNRLVEIINR